MKSSIPILLCGQQVGRPNQFQGEYWIRFLLPGGNPIIPPEFHGGFPINPYALRQQRTKSIGKQLLAEATDSPPPPFQPMRY